MERVNFHLTDAEIEGLEIISQVTGEKKARLIRKAIDEYIERKRWNGVTGIVDYKGVYA